jgi:FkbM family methyltransferase
MNLNKYRYYFESAIKLLADFRPLSTVLGVFAGWSRNGPFQIILPRQRVRFNVRGVMDIWSVKETFIDRFYERYGTPIGQGWTIVDIGGGIGDFTTYAALAHHTNRVYAFEPTPESYQLLQANLALNEVTNAQGYPLAIWSKKGVIQIDTNVGEPGQNISRADSGEAETGKVVVECLSLDEAFSLLGLNGCDLLKLDCEGAEYEILFNAPDNLLANISHIVMEYHNDVTPFNHVDLERFLCSKGFDVSSVVNVVHKTLGYLYARRS